MPKVRKSIPILPDTAAVCVPGYSSSSTRGERQGGMGGGEGEEQHRSVGRWTRSHLTSSQLTDNSWLVLGLRLSYALVFSVLSFAFRLLALASLARKTA